MKYYEAYTGEDVTREVLDSIKVGDLVIINDWKRPLRVRGVSENYFVMARPAFGETIYSVCEKKPWGGKIRNAMRGGMYHVGTDNGNAESHEFADPDVVRRYLDGFECGSTELSCRTSVPILAISIKKAESPMAQVKTSKIPTRKRENR